MTADGPMTEEAAAQAKYLHLAALRQARQRHKAIALELQLFFDSITSEAVPDRLVASLETSVMQQPPATASSPSEPTLG